MHSHTIYRTYEEFSELVDELSAEMFSSDEPVATFGTKIEHLRTFGPASKKSKGRIKERSIYTWLRNRTSGLDFGKEITDSNPFTSTQTRTYWIDQTQMGDRNLILA